MGYRFTRLWQDKMPFKMNLLLFPVVSVFYQQPFAIAKPTITEIRDYYYYYHIKDGLMNTVVDTLIQNGNELGNFQKFSSTLNTTIWAAKDTLELLDDLFDEFKENLEKLNVEMQKLDEHIFLKFQDEYFPMFYSTRSKLKEVRDTLRALAGWTISKTINVKKSFVLLDNEIKKGELVSLGAAFKEMKSLMILSEKILNKAYDEFNLTIEAFEKLNKKIQIDNQFLKKLKDSESKEYKEWETSVRAIAFGPIATTSILDVFGTVDALGCFGFCPVFGNAATVESTINKYKAAFRKFEILTNNVLVKGKQISNTLREANAFLNSERELIIEWTNNVETVTENIDSNPEEYSRKYAEIRSIFNDGLDDLQITAMFTKIPNF